MQLIILALAKMTNMAYMNILIHYIWSTKNREKVITKELKPILLSHIKSNSLKKEIFIDTMNCVEDQIHLLVSLGRDQSVSKVAQLIKGESAYWLNNDNKVKFLKAKFEWQDEYMAISVSHSIADKSELTFKSKKNTIKRKRLRRNMTNLYKPAGSTSFDIF